MGDRHRNVSPLLQRELELGKNARRSSYEEDPHPSVTQTSSDNIRDSYKDYLEPFHIAPRVRNESLAPRDNTRDEHRYRNQSPDASHYLNVATFEDPRNYKKHQEYSDHKGNKRSHDALGLDPEDVDLPPKTQILELQSRSNRKEDLRYSSSITQDVLSFSTGQQDRPKRHHYQDKYPSSTSIKDSIKDEIESTDFNDSNANKKYSEFCLSEASNKSSHEFVRSKDAVKSEYYDNAKDFEDYKYRKSSTKYDEDSEKYFAKANRPEKEYSNSLSGHDKPLHLESEKSKRNSDERGKSEKYTFYEKVEDERIKYRSDYFASDERDNEKSRPSRDGGDRHRDLQHNSDLIQYDRNDRPVRDSYRSQQSKHNDDDIKHKYDDNRDSKLFAKVHDDSYERPPRDSDNVYESGHYKARPVDRQPVKETDCYKSDKKPIYESKLSFKDKYEEGSKPRINEKNYEPEYSKYVSKHYENEEYERPSRDNCKLKSHDHLKSREVDDDTYYTRPSRESHHQTHLKEEHPYKSKSKDIQKYDKEGGGGSSAQHKSYKEEVFLDAEDNGRKRKSDNDLEIEIDKRYDHHGYYKGREIDQHIPRHRDDQVDGYKKEVDSKYENDFYDKKFSSHKDFHTDRSREYYKEREGASRDRYISRDADDKSKTTKQGESKYEILSHFDDKRNSKSYKEIKSELKQENNKFTERHVSRYEPIERDEQFDHTLNKNKYYKNVDRDEYCDRRYDNHREGTSKDRNFSRDLNNTRMSIKTKHVDDGRINKHIRDDDFKRSREPVYHKDYERSSRDRTIKTSLPRPSTSSSSFNRNVKRPKEDNLDTELVSIPGSPISDTWSDLEFDDLRPSYIKESRSGPSFKVRNSSYLETKNRSHANLRSESQRSNNPKRSVKERLYIKPEPGVSHKPSIKERLGFRCFCCKTDNHNLVECPAFQNLDLQSRWNFVKTAPVRICPACLETGHSIIDCTIKDTCSEECRSLRHKLLHICGKPRDPEVVVEILCLCCSGKEHSLEDCPDFKTLGLRQRWAVITKANRRLCTMCLKTCHTKAKCNLDPICKVTEGCTFTQHQLLHTCWTGTRKPDANADVKKAILEKKEVDKKLENFQKQQQDENKVLIRKLTEPEAEAEVAMPNLKWVELCTMCKSDSHKRRFCPRNICKKCNEKGHQTHDCKLQQLPAKQMPSVDANDTKPGTSQDKEGPRQTFTYGNKDESTNVQDKADNENSRAKSESSEMLSKSNTMVIESSTSQNGVKENEDPKACVSKKLEKSLNEHFRTRLEERGENPELVQLMFEFWSLAGHTEQTLSDFYAQNIPKSKELFKVLLLSELVKAPADGYPAEVDVDLLIDETVSFFMP